MPVERLLASYIVRATVRGGTRTITLHEIATGEMRAFGTYRELLDHLNAREEAAVRSASADPRVKKPP